MTPVGVSIVLVAAATVTALAQAPRGDAERGKQLFVKTGCYQCHGYEAQGVSTGPRLGPEAVAFVRFVAYVRKPTGDMPPYTARVMSDAELADVYAFVTSRSKPRKVPRFLGS
jgi:mono/diheme cytochrome c family protein